MKRLKKTFWITTGLPVAMLLGASSVAAQSNSLSDGFNQNAMRGLYSMSCAQARSERQEHILPASDQNAPPYFQNDGIKFSYYSPNLTAQQRRMATKLLQSTPDYIASLAYRGGAMMIFPHHIMEAWPQFKSDEAMWTKTTGMYYAVDRRLTIPFASATGKINTVTGNFDLFEYRSLTNDRKEDFFHELGHLIDDLAGDYMQTPNPDSRITSSPEMARAYESDLRNFAKLWRSTPEALRETSYLLPQEFKGIDIGGDHADLSTARKEAFAELWAQVQGHGKRNARIFLPKTYRYVENIDQILRDYQQRYGHACQNTDSYKLAAAQVR